MQVFTLTDGYSNNYLMRTKLIKQLYKWFGNDIKKLQAELSKTSFKEKCTFAFELDGHTYYKFTNSGDIPLQRLERIQVDIIMLENRLSKPELDTLIEIAQQSLNDAFVAFKQENKMNKIQHAIWAMEEIKSRKETLMFHPDILMDMAALNLIRDDENPFIINEDLHKEKVELFKTKGGELPFFLEAALNHYMPNSKELIQQLVELWESHKKIIEKSNTTYDTILGEIKPTTTSKHSEKI